MSDDIIERLDDFWPDNPADRKLIADSMREIERLRADRRERIATAALNGLIANAVVAHTPAQFALAAVVVADALIAELDKEGGASHDPPQDRWRKGR